VELQGDTSGDGVYNNDELGADGTVTAKVTLAADTAVGDTITVTDGAGNVILEREVTQDDLDNGIFVEVSPHGDRVDVTAQVTDPAGNKSPEATDSALVDTDAASAPTVELLGDTSGDGVYNNDELGADGTVTAKVTLAADTAVGDTITVTDGAGNVILEREVTQDDLDNGIFVEVSPHGDRVDVTAQVTDPAGNKSPEASDSALVDSGVPSVTVELLGDTNGDGVYNSAELGADNTVTAQVTLTAGTQVGDRIVITDTNGNVLVDRDVTQDDLTNGIQVEATVVGGKVEVTAQVSDAAGNTSPEVSDSALVDSGVPSVNVELLGDTNSDGVYNSAELGADDSVTAKVTLAADTAVGDTITIRGGNGQVILEREVTQDDLDNGIYVEVPRVGDKVEVTAQVTDPAGNASPEVSDSALVDSEPAPAPSVELLGDTNGDGIFNLNEVSAGAESTVSAQVTLQPGTQVGDRIIIKDTTGAILVDREVTQNDLDNGIQVEVSVGTVSGKDGVSVSAQVVDAAGNPSSVATDSAEVDRTPPPAPTITFQDDANTDGMFNIDEVAAGQADTVTALVNLQPGTEVGDRIVITDIDGTVLVDRVVTADDLLNGIEVEATIGDIDPSTGVTTGVQISAQVTDQAGNSSQTTTENAEVDLEISTPIADLDSTSDKGSSNSDNLTSNDQPQINLDGIDEDIHSITVTLTPLGGGDAITAEANWVNGQWELAGGIQLVNGEWRYQPDSQLADGSYEITVDVVDKAGNTSTSDKNNPLVVTIDKTLSVKDTAVRVDENTLVAGQELGSVLSGTETDIVNVGFYYNNTFNSVSHDGYFAIDANGVVSITQAGIDAGLNDYETWVTMVSDDGASLTDGYVIKAQDEAGNVGIKEFEYAVNDVPEPVDAQGEGGDDNLYVVNNQMTYAFGATYDEFGNPIAGAVKAPDSYDPSMGAVIDGAAGNDHIIGGSGNDVIIGGVNGQLHGGGAGEADGRHYGDVLEGGAGQDIFRWLSGDDVELNHIVDSENDGVAVDIITDFTLGNTSTNDQADILDLSDLLQGETADTLDQYLSVTQEGDNIIIHVDTDGVGGKDVTQQIVMENMGGVDANTFIDDLLNNGQLTID
ncbi:Ig-like domain-containing protein, partial [Photobacterium aphoticum]